MNKTILLCLFTVACSNSFDPFPAADAGPTSSTDSGEGQDVLEQCPPLRCLDDTFPTSYLGESCGSSACHGADHPNPNNNYETGDVFDRLVGLPSDQTNPGTASPVCANIPIIDLVDIPNSMLLRKLRGDHGTCGERMPFDGIVPEETVACLESWIERERCLRAGSAR